MQPGAWGGGLYHSFANKTIAAVVYVLRAVFIGAPRFRVTAVGAPRFQITLAGAPRYRVRGV